MRARGNRPRELGAPGRNRGGQAPAPCGAGAIHRSGAPRTGAARRPRTRRPEAVPRSGATGPGARIGYRGARHGRVRRGVPPDLDSLLPACRPDMPVRRAHSLLPSPNARPAGRHSQVSLRDSLARDPPGRCNSGRKTENGRQQPLIVRRPHSGAYSHLEHRRVQSLALPHGAPAFSTGRGSARRPPGRGAGPGLGARTGLSASPRTRAKPPPRRAPPPHRCCRPAPRRPTGSR